MFKKFDTSFKPNEQKCRYIRKRLISIQLVIFIFHYLFSYTWARRKGTQKPYSYFAISNKLDQVVVLSDITAEIRFTIVRTKKKYVWGDPSTVILCHPNSCHSEAASSYVPWPVQIDVSQQDSSL